MTGQDLLNELSKLPPDQLQNDIAIYDSDNDEYYQQGIELVVSTETCDVLDPGTPIIRL